MARPIKKLELTVTQRAELESMLRAVSTTHQFALRVQIVLRWADGERPADTERALAVALRTVNEWRRRYERTGLAGLSDLPRAPRQRTITPEKADEILQATVHNVPHEGTHWSQRLMAKHARVSRRQVVNVWRAADLRPHRLKTFKISRDPKFVEKVRDIVGLYMNPPDNALVLSVDEKTQIQALDRTQPMLQLRPGQIERRTHDYIRHGTKTLYAAFNVGDGKVIGQVTDKHRASEFLGFLRKVNRETPQDLDLHVILDNSSTHKTAEVLAWLAKHPRFHFHFTPTSASWMNAVEQWFGKLEERSLYRGVFTSADALAADIYRHIDAHNQFSAKRFKWTKSADKILASVDRAKSLPEAAGFLAGGNGSGH